MERMTEGAILTVASAGALLVLLAFSVPLTTLTSTASMLDAGPGGQAWILSAISVGAAAGLMSCGEIGDDYGRRRTFVVGALLLSATSLLAAMAPNLLVFVIARLLQGVGAAAILACSLGLVGHAFPAGRGRARATGVWAAAFGAGVSFGPLLSAGLDHLGGWRLPYVLTGVGAVALAIAGQTLLPESRALKPRRVDVAGSLLLGGGLIVLLAGLVECRLGWSRPLVLELLGTGLILLAGFIAHERRTKSPMLDLTLFRRPDFVGATVAALAAGAGVLSLVSLVPMLLERAMGVGTMLSAVVILAWSGTSVVTAFGARWLPVWLTPRTQLIAGLVGVAVAQLALGWLSPDDPIWRLLPGLLLAGIANGFLNAALGHQAVSSVPADRAAMGSGANNTARYLGSSIGLTIVTVLITQAGDASGADGLVTGWNQAVLITAGFSLVGALTVFFVSERREEAGERLIESGAE